MKEYLVSWRERYAKVLKDYPEFQEVSNLSAISIFAAPSYRNEQRLQQIITAALICDNPYTYDSRNVMEYCLETCNTPSDRNYYSDSPISYELKLLFRNRCSTPLYKIAVESLEQIYFTL